MSQIPLPEKTIFLNQSCGALFHQKYGCYVITVDLQEPLSRINGVDKQKILYIGSGILKTRIIKFRKVIEEKRRNGHSGAVTYVQRINIFESKFPLNQLLVHYTNLNSKEEALNHENGLMLEYEKNFGELPPLNSQRAKKTLAE